MASVSDEMAAALKAFGWDVGGDSDFAERYHSDPWVFNLANSVLSLTAEVKRLQAERDHWRDAHHAEVGT